MMNRNIHDIDFPTLYDKMKAVPEGLCLNWSCAIRGFRKLLYFFTATWRHSGKYVEQGDMQASFKA